MLASVVVAGQCSCASKVSLGNHCSEINKKLISWYLFNTKTKQTITVFQHKQRKQKSYKNIKIMTFVTWMSFHRQKTPTKPDVAQCQFFPVISRTFLTKNKICMINSLKYVFTCLLHYFIERIALLIYFICNNASVNNFPMAYIVFKLFVKIIVKSWQ